MQDTHRSVLQKILQTCDSNGAVTDIFLLHCLLNLLHLLLCLFHICEELLEQSVRLI